MILLNIKTKRIISKSYNKEIIFPYLHSSPPFQSAATTTITTTSQDEYASKTNVEIPISYVYCAPWTCPPSKLDGFSSFCYDTLWRYLHTHIYREREKLLSADTFASSYQYPMSLDNSKSWWLIIEENTIDS